MLVILILEQAQHLGAETTVRLECHPSLSHRRGARPVARPRAAADRGYTITGDYFRSPTEMVADGDLPTGLPAQFHMAIVYLAMTYYAGYEAAP